MANDKIFVFDLDDTLVDTQAKVRVVDDNGNVLERLGTQFHNDHVYEGGTHLDYSEFEDLDQLLSERELPAMQCLEYCLRNYPDRTYILTARQANFIIHSWLQIKGLDMWFSHVQSVDFAVYKSMQTAKPAYIDKWIGELVDEARRDGYHSITPKVFYWEDNVQAIKNTRIMLDEGSDLKLLYCNVSIGTLKGLTKEV